jgi:hypothetical protein
MNSRYLIYSGALVVASFISNGAFAQRNTPGGARSTATAVTVPSAYTTT